LRAHGGRRRLHLRDRGALREAAPVRRGRAAAVAEARAVSRRRAHADLLRRRDRGRARRGEDGRRPGEPARDARARSGGGAPPGAMGTGRAASPDDCQSACTDIARELSARPRLRILYGGSVTAENAAALLGRESVDGFLIGGASLSAADFASIAAAGRA